MENITDVQFRIFKGEVLAVFPYEIQNNKHVLSYCHNEQHSECFWQINMFSKAAKAEQYQPLKKELEGLGYVLNVIKRRSHKRFLKEYYKKIRN